ncbi:membrane protein insertion efficiency factor YidD [Marinicella sp. S1101]|uniref:membrane protein insertion efficiency factor YidD n=1 Tax=Marinicella marina TaxID=2996016 RepID=UPI002260B0B9|nr:membrane protein insertion efficiency factor YidD [Marinicella marina]MCX7553710.1 membrane protein insertion efficiency factor YidD [Marinicella marina]MDJ1140800.1 membrane protein insertion efficiency factor YidD [Marinicella marina]
MIRSIFISILRGYQYLISPMLGNRCRFYPSCSEYMIQAVRRFGVFKGVYLGLKRLSRCQPMCEGGVDPVPEEYPGKKAKKSQ